MRSVNGQMKKEDPYRNSVKHIDEDIARAGLCYWTNEDFQGKAEDLEIEQHQAPTHCSACEVLMDCHTRCAK